MRIKISLKSIGSQTIDINYNYSLSSFIYNLLMKSNKDYSNFLHEEGYEKDNKYYKMFSFSMLMPENYKVEGSTLTIYGKMAFYITSPIKEFLMCLVDSAVKCPQVRINRGEFKVTSVEVTPEPAYSRDMRFKFISPVTMSTAFLNEDSRLKKVDLYLEDRRFTENIRSNILSKYEVLYGKQPVDTQFDVRFLQIEKYKKGKLINYKDNIKIKGYLGPIEIHGNPELIEVAYECGLGDRNSLGMGMIEVNERR